MEHEGLREFRTPPLSLIMKGISLGVERSLGGSDQQLLVGVATAQARVSQNLSTQGSRQHFDCRNEILSKILRSYDILMERLNAGANSRSQHENCP